MIITMFQVWQRIFPTYHEENREFPTVAQVH